MEITSVSIDNTDGRVKPGAKLVLARPELLDSWSVSSLFVCNKEVSCQCCPQKNYERNAKLQISSKCSLYHVSWTAVGRDVPTGCPRKNVPLGEGQTSPKETFFWDTWYICKKAHNLIHQRRILCSICALLAVTVFRCDSISRFGV